MSEPINTCPECGGTEWTWIPDSLASHCNCGFVRVCDGVGHVPGASLQQWLKDIYGVDVPDGISFNGKATQ